MTPPAERTHVSSWTIAVAGAILLAAVCVHFYIGWAIRGSDLVGADAPAHYTTGVMVFDYLRGGLFSNPLEYAQGFYIRFPKVALGHWPPVYYVLQAVAFAVGGPSIAAARALSVVICLALAGVIFQRVRTLHGLVIGLLAAACFLMLPMVTANSWLVMSDLLMTLFVLLAALALADFLDSDRRGDLAWFALWSVLAILTKGVAWGLGPFALLAPLLAGRRCFRNRWYWLAGTAILAASAPFYLWARQLHVGYPVDAGRVLAASATPWSGWTALRLLRDLMPPLFHLGAGVGVVAALRRKLSTTEAVMLALVLSQCLFLVILPLTQEPRYFLPSAAALLILFSRALTLAGRGFGPVAASVVCIALGGWISPVAVHGYRAAVDSIPYHPKGTAMLVASDSHGEGAFIAERLEGDLWRAGAVLRGSQVLSRSQWSGAGYHCLFQTPAEVVAYLRSIPVRYIVIDRASETTPHRELLEAGVRAASADFALRGTFPVTGSRHGDILIFENVRDTGRSILFRTRIGSSDVEYRVR